MADDDPGQAPQNAGPTFEAEIRQQRELMVAMASREKWDGESRWILQARRLAGGALYGAAIVAVVVILWIASSVVLSS